MAFVNICFCVKNGSQQLWQEQVSCWWAWRNRVPVLSKTSLSSPGMPMSICRSLGFSIWGCDIQTPQTQKGLEAIALSSQVQVSVFKTSMKWENLEASKMRKKQSKQFPLLIKVFIQSILVFNIIMYEMQEDGQSPADVLGERKISF